MPDLFTVKPDTIHSVSTTFAREYFDLITAKLLNLSNLTRVAFLTKRVTKPQAEDMKKLERTVQYIGTPKILVSLYR